MPYAVISVGGGKYKVVNTSTGKIHAEKTTKDKAEAQLRLLRGVEHGMSLASKDALPSGKDRKLRDKK